MIRSGYSFRCAVGKIDDVVSRVKEIGWKELPITDRCSTFSFVRLTAACEKEGLRPIYGVELGVVPALGEKRPTIDYWKFLAKKTLRPLHDLIALATANPGREPSLLYSQAMAADGLIKIAGERVLLDRVKKQKDLFVGLSPATSRGLASQVIKKGLKFIATPDNLYPRSDDLEMYRVMIGFRSTTQTYPQWIVSDKEWRESMQWTVDKKIQDEAVKNRKLSLSSCVAEMQESTLFSPERKKTLRQMCVEGASRLKVDLKNPIYAERLDKELRLIEEKEFEDYFYIVADLIQWSKQRMIVGPGRGSSGGSLVCFLLNITAVDPIKYDLVFERFIDTTRADFPDIDIDFSDARRHMAFEHVEKTYGKDHVARLGTVSMFQSKSALNAIGASLKIPKWKIEKVSDSVIRRSKGDSRADLKIADTLTDSDAGKDLLREYPEAIIAGRMESHPSNAGQHAAGIVITSTPVRDYVAVDSRTGATMCDWQDAKDLNLLKLDALGLTQLSVFERTLELAKLPQSSDYLEALPLDDPAAFDVLNQKKFSGIFQFTGPTLQQIAIAVETKELEDLVAMTALCRPGPIGSGGTRSWINRKNGKEDIDVPHPLLEPYTRASLGIMVYQEQIMRLGREIGNLSWAEVTELRRSMGKSLGAEFFSQFGDRWKKGAVEKGIPKDICDEVWDDMCLFGMYSFNRSHSVAYALVSYYACWLKAHHPLEFAAATLDAESDPGIQLVMLREMREEGTDYVPVDADHSTDRWEVKNGKLIGPLTQIKGIGPAAVRQVLDARKGEGEIKPALRKKLSTAKTDIDSLFPVSDAIQRQHPDIRASKGIVTPPTPCVKVQPGINGDVVIFALLKRLYPLDENEPGRVAKRGHAVTGPTKSINFFMQDDTGDLFCKISRHDYSRLAPIILNDTRQGKSLFAIKGRCPADFRMLWVQDIRYLGEIDK